MARRFYWLKLKENFFKTLKMKKLRSVAGGDTYTIIYLKMQLLSLENDGELYYEGVEDSFEKEIALVIDENLDDVKLTIQFLLSNDLLLEKGNGVFELTETKTCIGSETASAERVRRFRDKENCVKALQCNTPVTSR